MNRQGSPPPPIFDQFQAAREDAGKRAAHIDCGHATPAAHCVPVAMRQCHQIAGRQFNPLAIFDFEVRPALAEEVIDDHVRACRARTAARARSISATRYTRVRRTPH